MSTVLLRLCGPMQSWGTESRFEQRGTGREPSKSGVVGICAAALGRSRGADIRDLAALHMGVRVLREGILQSDFQTVGGTHRSGDSYGVARFDGSAPEAILTNRHYLADADFLVGLEGGDAAFLQQIDAALRHPVFPLSLGRRAYVPSVPIALPETGVRAQFLRDALLGYPWPEGMATARCIYEDPDGSEQRHDQPVAFTWPARYVMRLVRVTEEVAA
jgi:CRISPR system Cascade subunit CasD